MRYETQQDMPINYFGFIFISMGFGLIRGLTLPLGVHFFCVAKRNITKDKYAGAYLKCAATPLGVEYRDVFHSKATLIALFPKVKLCGGVDENSLRSDTRPLNPPNSLIFGGNNMG